MKYVKPALGIFISAVFLLSPWLWRGLSTPPIERDVLEYQYPAPEYSSVLLFLLLHPDGNGRPRLPKDHYELQHRASKILGPPYESVANNFKLQHPHLHFMLFESHSPEVSAIYRRAVAKAQLDRFTTFFFYFWKDSVRSDLLTIMTEGAARNTPSDIGERCKKFEAEFYSLYPKLIAESKRIQEEGDQYFKNIGSQISIVGWRPRNFNDLVTYAFFGITPVALEQQLQMFKLQQFRRENEKTISQGRSERHHGHGSHGSHSHPPHTRGRHGRPGVEEAGETAWEDFQRQLRERNQRPIRLPPRVGR